jgi:flagellar hook-associated protein 3 FlgL
MIPLLPGATQKYLDDLNRMQSEMNTLQGQVSSGLRVQHASDDPFAVASILHSQQRIGQLQQSQTNLGQLQGELQVGDAALQQAIQSIDSAVSLASQAGSNASDPTQNAILAQQVQSILTQLVNLSATTSGGRFIFSGDLDRQALYALDPTQPTGVKQLATATSTRVVTDVNGSQVWLARTASDIFDARDANGAPTAANAFAAVNALLVALQSNNSAGAMASITNLQAAADHLNQELGHYGVGETTATDALDAAGKSLVTEQQTLSSLRDTDLASAAVQMTQLSTQQQAALQSRAKLSKLNLFDFLA